MLVYGETFFEILNESPGEGKYHKESLLLKKEVVEGEVPLGDAVLDCW